MRISKFMLPALTVAGALALAGCGGSDSMPDTGAGAGASGFTDATLPGTARGIVYNTNNQPIVQLAAGTNHKVGSSNVSVTCPAASTAGCSYRVTNTNNLPGIEVTGNAEVVLTSTIGVPVPSAAQPDGNWLSGPSLAAALPASGTGPFAVTVNGVKRTFAANKLGASGAPGAPLSASDLAGTGLSQLWLHHNRDENDPDFLVWGTWIDAPTSAAPSPKPEQTFGGSVAHGAPTKKIGSATYLGGANGYYKAGSGSWKPWSGTARLSANFVTQKVTGAIANTFDNDGAVATRLAVTATDVNSVRLGMADIGSSLSGAATIRGTGDGGATTARNAPSKGTWRGAFFGPTTGDPTGVAGSFSANRAAAQATIQGTPEHTPGKRHGDVESFDISGAFGAPVCTSIGSGCP